MPAKQFNDFILKERVRKSLLARGASIDECARKDCPRGKELKVGDHILSKRRNADRDYYHFDCWEELRV